MSALLEGRSVSCLDRKHKFLRRICHRSTGTTSAGAANSDRSMPLPALDHAGGPRHERFLTRGDEASYFVGATSMIAGSETLKPSLAITRTRRGRGPICSSVSVSLLTVRPVATVSHVSPSPPSCTR